MNKVAQLLLPRIFIALVVLGPSSLLAVPPDPDWEQFVIPGFGTRIDYPAGIFSVSEGKPEIGEGERRTTPDNRASFTIYSRTNDTGDTPGSYLRKHLKLARSNVQYQRVTPAFFAISMGREGTIYYSRCNFSYGRSPSIHCFDLVYPQQEKRAWDAIVTRMSLSLRPLRG
jgi:hypothetical protein